MKSRTRYAVVSLIALMAASCGSSADPASSEATSTSTEAVSTTSTSIAVDTIRVDIAGGCPVTVAGHHDDSSTAATWIANPDLSGLDTVFVPGQPTAALGDVIDSACRWEMTGAWSR